MSSLSARRAILVEAKQKEAERGYDMPNGTDPYGDFSFEEVGGEVVAAPSVTPSRSVPADGEETEYWPEATPTGSEYERSADTTDIEGITPFGASFARRGNGQ